MLARFLQPNKRDFTSLDEREILSLAIVAEEEDGQIYAAYAEKLREAYPGSAALFEGMAAEEHEHRRRLLDLYTERFGDQLVPIRREHVRGFIARKPIWLMQNLDIETIRQQVWEMEISAHRFYIEAARMVTDARVRKLLGDLAEQEAQHQKTADRLEKEFLGESSKSEEKEPGAACHQATRPWPLPLARASPWGSPKPLPTMAS